MWGLLEMSSEIVTHRYLAKGTDSRTVPWRCDFDDPLLGKSCSSDCVWNWFLVFVFLSHLSQLMRLWHFFVLRKLRKLILQTRMRSHPEGLDVRFSFGPFVYFHTSCVLTVKALARLRGCAGSPEPSLVAYVISTNISWAGSFDVVSGLRNLVGSVPGHYHFTFILTQI